MKLRDSLKSRILFPGVATLMALACGAWQVSTAQGPLAARESRGRQIYFHGTSPSEKAILAYLGDSSLEVPGSSMACANCHGMDGRGKPEGGVIPSNITWEALTKPYGVTHPSGRKHPAYTNRGIELALTRGLDPAGNKLLGVMPRYSMSREDMADLVLYLARLGKDIDPGIHESKIVIGTLVPAQGSLAEMGQVIKAVTAGVFADVNAAGGIYHRRLELSVAETAETPAATRANLERSFTAEPFFAMTGAFIAGAENEVLPFSTEKEVPLIGPFTLFPRTGAALNSRVFYLLSGIDDQSRAVIEFAAKNPEIKGGGVAVVYPQNENSKAVFEAIQRQTKAAGLADAQPFGYVAGTFDSVETLRKVRQAKREAVLFFGSGEDALAFMREAEKSGWFPFIFLSSTTPIKEIFNAPAGFDGRLFMAFSTSPDAQSAQGLAEFGAFSAKHKLPSGHPATQILAYSAAKLLVEALKRAGKDLSREKLIEALDGFYEYQTGLTPPITYGPNRRIGAMGAYVITINLKEKKFVPASGWIGLGQPK
ncbi:MAG: ABC transporter substrate-binding protein [Pyrinomonadaceae bacterium]|nr:ABC transporter substrate-binding protein [Pyrinomonadaceae bacterium]